MTFILRIFFMGLIAFVPSQDGKELTVLLVDARQGYVASDGSVIPPHMPMLLARAGDCKGHCGAEGSAIARILFSGASPDASLASALNNGAAWQLNGSDLTILPKDAEQKASSAPLRIELSRRNGKSVPGNPDERKDFSWVADLRRIDPPGTIHPDMLALRPQKGLVVARLRLHSGTIWTYRLVSVDGKVPPLGFKTLQADRVTIDYSQALADWVAAEIEIPGNAVKVVENRFGDGQSRTMDLTPHNGLVELAVMNIPKPSARPDLEGESHRAHEPGKHFEIYYDLAATGSSKNQRPVPHITTSGDVNSPAVHRQETRSELLEALGLSGDKGFYDRILCPVVQLSDGG